MNFYWIEHLKANGQTQMALDEACLLWLKNKNEPTFVARTYVWEPSTLSIGVHQSLEKLSKLGYQTHEHPIVRRPTGGRAILHGKDISFMIATNCDEWLKLSVNESYCKVLGFLKEALTQLGVETNTCSPQELNLSLPYQKTPMCFETTTAQDLKGPDGQKLSGSAQLRRNYGLLQHGAMFLAPYLQASTSLIDFDVMFKNAIEAEFGLSQSQNYENLEGLTPCFNEVVEDYTPLNSFVRA